MPQIDRIQSHNSYSPQLAILPCSLTGQNTELSALSPYYEREVIAFIGGLFAASKANAREVHFH